MPAPIGRVSVSAYGNPQPAQYPHPHHTPPPFHRQTQRKVDNPAKPQYLLYAEEHPLF